MMNVEQRINHLAATAVVDSFASIILGDNEDYLNICVMLEMWYDSLETMYAEGFDDEDPSDILSDIEDVYGNKAEKIFSVLSPLAAAAASNDHERIVKIYQNIDHITFED